MHPSCRSNKGMMGWKKREDGFTLLEVLMASVILGIGLMALGTTETLSVTNSRTGQEITIGTAASEEIFERMRRNQASILSYNGFDTANAATRPIAAGTVQSDYDQWKLEVERVPGACASVQVTSGIPIVSVSSATVTYVWPPCASAASRRVVVQTLF